MVIQVSFSLSLFWLPISPPPNPRKPYGICVYSIVLIYFHARCLKEIFYRAYMNVFLPSNYQTPTFQLLVEDGAWTEGNNQNPVEPGEFVTLRRRWLHVSTAVTLDHQGITAVGATPSTMPCT